MPIVSVAVCPHPPLIVPEMSARAAEESDDLRTGCARAVDLLYASGPQIVVIVGTGPVTRAYRPPAVGSFAGYGLPLTVSLDGHPPTGDATLPLSLTVGGWLLRGRATEPPRSGYAVAADVPPAGCAALGRTLAALAPRVGLLVMGDGSARRGEKSPGYAHPGAEDFDASVTKALAAADTAALLALDVDLAAELLVAGRAPWQVLAGAVEASPGSPGSWHGEVLYDAAPYGVNYTVATWERG